VADVTAASRPRLHNAWSAVVRTVIVAKECPNTIRNPFDGTDATASLNTPARIATLKSKRPDALDQQLQKLVASRSDHVVPGIRD
jgi:hypothetical protein